MTITVYHYPACSTCRRALAWLERHGIPHQRVHIVEQPPPIEVLTRALAKAGNMRALFNTSGQSYREGNYKERLPTLATEQALAALTADGKLIKRPLVVGDDVALVGFDEATWARTLR